MPSVHCTCIYTSLTDRIADPYCGHPIHREEATTSEDH